MNLLSFNSDALLLIARSGQQVKGVVYYNPNRLTSYIVISFTPYKPLILLTTYAAELTTGIEG
jgi:hypothetical protein